MDKALKTTVSVVGILILLVLAFAGGVVFDRTADRIEPMRLGMDTGKIEDAVSEVATILSEQALEPSNETSLTSGAVSGMLAATGDEHAAYFDTKHFQYFNEQSEG